MSTIALWLLSVGVATLGASASAELRARVSGRARARRAALRLPRTRIEHVRSGDLVRISGRLELASEVLSAPFSQRRCAHYEAAVDRAREPGAFVRAVTESASRAFWLVDESGRAMCEMEGALVDLVIDHYWSAGQVDAETRFELERFLFAKGPRGGALLREPAHLRYSEGALEEGERVHVVGVADWISAAEVGQTYRDTGRRLLLRAPKRGRLFVSDQPDD